MSGIRCLAYSRVSTDEQGLSGLGLQAQQQRMVAECVLREWECEVLEDVQTARTLDRPALQRALDALSAKRADVLMVAKLDRLSRSIVDWAALIERSRKEGWSIVALDLGVDTTTPSGELVANVMMSIAQWERRVIGERTRDALAVRRSQGVRLGRPVRIPPEVEALVTEAHRRGHSIRAICASLNETQWKPVGGGKRWQPSTVGRILKRGAEA